MSASPVPLGAHLHDGRTQFGVYSSRASEVAIQLYATETQATERVPLAPLGDGFFSATAELGAGALYKIVVDGQPWPDPFARFLPFGVHGPAMVCASTDYRWQHPAPAPALGQSVIYELHIGTFTAGGTYLAAMERLPYLAELGITTIELMPLAAFAGTRGWGYDGVALFAPFCQYGTPDQLRAFVDAAHGLGLAVLLDVVYNHLGPAGNYLPTFYPGYFSRDAKNGWGDAPDFSQPLVRHVVVQNALYWLTEFRFDGLRLDAVHALHDPTDAHIVSEIAGAVAALSPKRLLIAEDERNSAALYFDGHVDAIWADDFHHQVRTTLTGEADGYYAAYPRSVEAIAQTIRRGWLYEGQIYPPSGKPRGHRSDGIPAAAFVYCLENHDQIGNRALGERLDRGVSLDAYGAVSTLLLFLPMTPLLFMGQEWAASTPFLYFTDHEPDLGRAIVEGRRSEFRSFRAFADETARAKIPDPQAVSTFTDSRLRWTERDEPRHRRIATLYRQLLNLRKSDTVLSNGEGSCTVRVDGELLSVERRAPGQGSRLLLVNFASGSLPLPESARQGQLLLSSSDSVAVGAEDIAALTALIFVSAA